MYDLEGYQDHSFDTEGIGAEGLSDAQMDYMRELRIPAAEWQELHPAERAAYIDDIRDRFAELDTSAELDDVFEQLFGPDMYETYEGLNDSKGFSEKDWLCMSYEEKCEALYVWDERIREMQRPQEALPAEYFECVSDVKQLEKFQNIECIENCIETAYEFYSSGKAERFMEGNLETREDLACEFFENIKACMGLDDVSLTFEEMQKNDCGGYYPIDNSIHVNSRMYLENPDPRGLLKTIVHESEHAFQQKCIDNPDDCNVSREVLKIWEYNNDNYKDSQNYGFEAYREQPLEKDAFDVEKYVFAQVDKRINLEN